MADLKVGRIEQLTHTPPPWSAHIARPISNHAGGFSVEADGVVICGCAGWPPRAGESAANARLLAAAPELLAALKAIVAVLQKEAPGTALNHHQYDAIGIQAHAAIAKAEGR
jgi:hypothetical protein